MPIWLQLFFCDLTVYYLLTVLPVPHYTFQVCQELISQKKESAAGPMVF
jgi:hypothetical protein